MLESPTSAPSRQLLAAIVESSDDAIVSKDLNGIITSWNPGAERIFGYSASEAIGQPVLILIPEDRQEEEPGILDQIRRGKRVDHFETIRRTKDGRLLEISLSISPIRDENGVIIGASKIARDITERKQIERQLAAAKAELQSYAEQLEKKVEERTKVLQQTIGELESFSYSLTHDLRAPLRAIQSYLQILLEDHGGDLKKAALTNVIKTIESSQRMDRMVLELLAFTRLSHEETSLEPIDVEKLVKDILSTRPDLQPPNAEIVVESSIEKVMGNERSLIQCLTNLLDNAAKFVAPGTTPRIKVYSKPHGSALRLYVEDNGIGISMEEQHHLFRLFSRLFGSQYPGTGIGLAIVQKAAQRMGGTAGVDSESGKGSRFWLQLPKDRSILIAEDDENDVAFIKRAFAQAEVTALNVASDGQVAIAYLSGAGEYADRVKFPLPSLLMLDLKMPRKTGMDVLRWVRSQASFRALPVIIFSSSVHPAEIAEAYKIGANAFITKPSGTSERAELARLIKGFWLTLNQLP